MGAAPALLGVAAGYLALSMPRARLAPAVLGTAGVGLAMALWGPPLVIVDVPEAGRLLSYREGALGAVSVVEDASGVARLRGLGSGAGAPDCFNHALVGRNQAFGDLRVL